MLPMPGSYFALVLREWGNTPELRQALLNGVADSHAQMIDVGQQLKLVRALNSLLPAGWGLKLGALFDASTHGPVGVATSSAQTLADALDVIVRYGHVRTPFMRFNLTKNRQRVRLHFIDTDALTESDALPLHEATLVGVQNLLRPFFYDGFDGVIFEVDQPRPIYGNSYHDYLKGKIEFACPETAISFDTALLANRSPLGDIDQFHAAIRQLLRIAEALDVEDPLIWNIRQIITLSDEIPSLSFVANQLGFSDRTLIRQLGRLNTSYRALVDAHRRTRADVLLLDDRVPIAEVGYRLGYTDLANFGRSCRRWFGMSPGQYRQSTKRSTR